MCKGKLPGIKSEITKAEEKASGILDEKNKPFLSTGLNVHEDEPSRICIPLYRSKKTKC